MGSGCTRSPCRHTIDGHHGMARRGKADVTNTRRRLRGRSKRTSAKFGNTAMRNSNFPCLVYKEAYACLTVVCLRVVHQVATLESGETFLSSSDFFDPYQVSFHVFSISTYSNSCTCSFISNVLTLCVAIFSLSPLGGGSS